MCDCIFCKIAQHEIPVEPVYEDDQVIAFDDMNPQAPVHTLVVPKVHVQDITGNLEPETLVSLHKAICEVGIRKGLTQGLRVISNAGADAGQTVMHLHFHVLGGTSLGEGLLPEV
ncbi:HIT domain-containing protein [Collinsella sp. zg1085]|uniref:HIT domain-containing protein n=1 Tax=Collinsella sp. zg1085 TaxID=2844380 RepID=UPI001C0BA87B|nr:HIT domain-containing protein [Collinsella sp. zg1085]QWT18003.1 HIT domain-containing protein [Collinsella sp. zg1085]